MPLATRDTTADVKASQLQHVTWIVDSDQPAEADCLENFVNFVCVTVSEQVMYMFHSDCRKYKKEVTAGNSSRSLG